MRFQQGRQGARQPVCADAVTGGDGDPALDPLMSGSRSALDGGGFVLHVAGVINDRPPQTSGSEDVPATFEQRAAQMGFQRAHAAADRGLAQPHDPAGSGVAARFEDGERQVIV